MQTGDVVEVRAARLEKGGRAVGEVDGVAVHVHGLLPDEVGLVRLAHVGKQRRAYGDLVKVLTPSVHRRAPACPHQGVCGGCPMMIADEGFVADIKKAILGAMGLNVDRVVRDDRPMGYRWSSKRVLGVTSGKLVAGSYQPGSHDLAAMTACGVDHPDVAACFDELEEVAGRLGTTSLRYAWAKTNGEGQVLLTLVLSSEDTSVEGLAAELERPAGVASCVQDEAGNAMRGHTLRHLRGLQALEVKLCDVPVRVGPLGFLQPNPPIAARAYPELIGSSRGRLAFDLYAGAGITTHLLRKQYDVVLACESWPESAAELGVEPQTAEAFLGAQTETPDLIVANPPRAGLGAAVCEAIVAMALRHEQPMRLHIMSCEPRALARDIERLTEAGTFEVLGARAYDTLPQTAHIEVVAWLATSTSPSSSPHDDGPL